MFAVHTTWGTRNSSKQVTPETPESRGVNDCRTGNRLREEQLAHIHAGIGHVMNNWHFLRRVCLRTLTSNFSTSQCSGIWSSQGDKELAPISWQPSDNARKNSTHTLSLALFPIQAALQLSSKTLTGLVPTRLLRWENVRRHCASNDSTSSTVHTMETCLFNLD